MSATEIQKKIAYDLTLEYVRQNNLLKTSNENPTVKRIKDIKSKYDEILQAVKENNFL